MYYLGEVSKNLDGGYPFYEVFENVYIGFTKKFRV